MAETNGRLIPLLAMYSSTAEDYFYTTVPQMALAAHYGTLSPFSVYGTTYAFVGPSPSGFDRVANGTIDGILTGAQVWVFSTFQNPNMYGAPLLPLIRLSYACPSPSPPPGACAANNYHVDHALSTNGGGEIAGFLSVGYQIDGVEGYVYDPAYTQPSGTVGLLRAYNSTIDDHAVFPSTEQTNMAALGYTLDVTLLGYVYLVTTSPPPL